MLQNDFYKIIDSSVSETGWYFQIELNPSHPIYEGHFPEQPIVPGVCTLQIIRECTENILKKEIQISQISSCKYLSVVNPLVSKILTINIVLKESDSDNITLLAEGTSQNIDFIKLKANVKIV